MTTNQTRALAILAGIVTSAAGTELGTELAAHATATPLERYERFVYDVVDRDLLTDDEAVDLVFKGIHSKDPRIVRLTVQALHFEAGTAGLHLYWPAMASGPTRVGRPLGDVPGLRDFLLEYAREGIEQVGVRTPDTGMLDDAPGWTFAFLPLAFFFPGDAAVERFLLNHYIPHPSGDGRLPVDAFLNAGRFTTNAANAERRRVLAATTRDEGAATEFHNVTWAAGAAAGLAFAKTDAGLAALVEELDRGVAVAEIAEAIAAHGRQALPHRARLWSVLLEFDPERAQDPCAVLMREANKGLDNPAANCPSPRLRIEEAVTKLDALADRYPPPGEVAGPYVPASNATLVAYEHLVNDLDNPDFHDGKLAEVVFNGVHRHDLRVVDWTVRALAEDALAVNLPDVLAGAPRRRTRALSSVPGLRGFLMEQAAEGLAESGFGAFAADRPDLERLSTPLRCALPLAVYFAGDLAVHDFLLRHWRERRHRAGGAELAGAVRLLNAGGFRTEAADRLRTELLASGEARHVAWAARGLGRSQTDAGLAALAAALPRGVASGAVAEAIALHGKRAAPHLARLRELAPPPAQKARVAAAAAKLAIAAAP